MTTSAQSGSRMVAQRYRLDRVIGRGAMGAVWQAEDTTLHRTVALKEVVLAPGLSREERAIACERTFREARAIARLAHPNVVTLYDVVEEDKRPWVVMELVQSRSLAQVLKEDGPMDAGRAAQVGLAVLGALQAAHEAGITHRDVKPGNILIGDENRVKLTDFGIARAAGDMTLTGTGLLVGSPSYMAPEVIRGEELRPSADLFGFGATLYCAVEGHPPFNGGDAMSTLQAVVSDPPKPYKRAGALAPVLDGLLEKDPRHRLTAAQARQMLLQAQRGEVPARLAAPPPSATRATVAVPPRQYPGARAESTQAIGGAYGGAQQPQWGRGQGQPPVPPVLLPTGESRARHPGGYPPGARPPSSGRSGWKVVAGVVAAVVLIAGGIALSRAMNRDSGGGTSHQAGTPQQRETPRPGVVPAGYEKYVDPGGRYTVSVPQGWKSSREKLAERFTEPSGERFIRVYEMARNSDPQRAFGERGFGQSHDGYTRLQLGPVDYRGYKAAEWEFTYDRDDGTRHVLWRSFDAGGKLFGIYISVPDKDFAASRKLFDTAASSFALT